MMFNSTKSNTQEGHKNSITDKENTFTIDLRSQTTGVNTFFRKTNFLEELKNSSGNIKRACQKINISRTTYYKWIKKDSKFKKNIHILKENLIDDIETSLIDRIHNDKNGGILAIQWLKAKAKHRGWGESNEDDKKNIKVKIEFV